MTPRKRYPEDLERLAVYNRAQEAGSERAAYGFGTLEDHNAFVMRWGTPEELDAKGRELDAMIEWWARKGPNVAQADLDAIRGLELAQDRIRELFDTAETVEAALRERGYELRSNPKLKKRLLVEIAPHKRGPKKTLLNEWIVEMFNALVELGTVPRENTLNVRSTIALRLAEDVHPDLLDPKKDGRIYAALYAHLQGDRDRKPRGERKRPADSA